MLTRGVHYPIILHKFLWYKTWWIGALIQINNTGGLYISSVSCRARRKCNLLQWSHKPSVCNVFQAHRLGVVEIGYLFHTIAVQNTPCICDLCKRLVCIHEPEIAQKTSTALHSCMVPICCYLPANRSFTGIGQYDAKVCNIIYIVTLLTLWGRY